MANSGGHWKNLAEAQKLTQSTKVPGVFEEDIKRNNPLDFMPVAQAAGTGLKIEWLRESTTTDDSVTEADVGDQLVWSDDIEYTEVETTLRYMYLQRKLDKYVESIYGTYNNYRAQALLEMEKGLKRTVGDRIFYADTTYGGTPTQFDGLHALAAERSTPATSSTWTDPPATTYSKLNLDMESGALSLLYLRTQIDAMRYGVDQILIPAPIGIRLDAAYQERGFTYAVSSNGTNHLMYLTQTLNELGQPVLYFMGIPFVRTDYLKREEDGTGTGGTSNARAAYSSTVAYSIFCVKYGDVLAKQPGLTYGFGSKEEGVATGDFYSLWVWERLEDYNAGGLRMDHYGTVLLGSTMGLGRIFDITDSAIVA